MIFSMTLKSDMKYYDAHIRIFWYLFLSNLGIIQHSLISNIILTQY